MSDDDDLAAALALAPLLGGPEADLEWLLASHRRPARFFAALHGALAGVAVTAPKSRIGERFDLYHDMVIRHLGSGRAALLIYEARAPEGQRWRSVSYEELHARCTRGAASWTLQGVAPGAALCVVLPPGLAGVVALLTGLRLGACVSLLEPGGPDYLALRLAALAPKHIATDPFYAPLLGPAAGLMLGPDPMTVAPELGSYSYRPGEQCAALFSPLRQPSHVPVPLRCDDIYLGALRDGAVALALRPGDLLAAPGFDILQHQPALVFAALLLGATFVQLDAEEVLRDPLLLCSLPLRSVGLTAPVRDALLRARVTARPRWAHVFKNPEEPTDWSLWRAVIEALHLQDTPMSNLLIEAASGGALLSSPRRPGRAQLAALMNVTAAAGRPWRLLDFTGSGQEAAGDVGVFAPLAGVADEGDEGAPVDARHVVIGRRTGAEYLYGGTIEPRRGGRTYPVDEVLSALADCPFLDGASVVAVTAGGPTVEHRFILIGFTGAESAPRFTALHAHRLAEIGRVLATRLTPDFLPDRIELFPYHARRQDGLVDHGWCQSQYLSGSLFRKARTPVFRLLTALRGGARA